MLKTSVANLQFSSLKGPIYIFCSVDNTKLPLYSPTNAAPQFL